MKSINNNFHYTSEGKFRAKTSMQSFSDTLSVKVKSHLNTLDKILKTSQEADIAEKISDLEFTIQNETDLTEDQLILLYSATRTAEASYKYWSKNLTKWAKLVRNKSKKSVTFNSGNYNNLTPTTSLFWDSVRDVAVADVGGAAAGAAYTWAFNAVPGGGQVAYGSTIAGTAAATSTYQAVTEIADAIFG